jgi:hypothetical protein
MSKHAVCVVDFTDNSCNDFSVIKDWLVHHCKKWCFQKEMGSKTKRLHWQGRFSLKVKRRIQDIPNPLKLHFSVTSNENKTNDFYVMKEDTRLEGPFSSEDEEVYIPRQYRNIELRPWQKLLLEKSKSFNDRRINLVYDPQGNKGKSLIAHWARLHLDGVVIPPINDGERLVASACNICMARGKRQNSPMFIDLPRAMGKERLYGIYTSIEQIKTGWLYDLRNKFKDFDIDSPSLWVFSNKMPENGVLSADRWNVWQITDDLNELLPVSDLDFLAN